MNIIKEEGKRPIKAWVGTKAEGPDIEYSALEQLKNLSGLSFIHPNGVAVMPDVHAGKGSTVGTVIATEKAIIPAAVGVDIGCGMNAVRLSLTASDLPESLKELRERIESAIPTGDSQHPLNADSEARFGKSAATNFPGVFSKLVEAGWGYDKNVSKAVMQLGSLGGGNHFIELCLDENQDVWVMLHSGSRGIGNIIGRVYIEKAKRRMEGHFIHLPDSDLAYIPEDTEDFRDYMEAVEWAQGYALENRRVMMGLVLDALRGIIDKPFTITHEAVNCHHNYVARENHFGRNVWVTRKGAIRAREGDLGIIPGSMGAKSYIVRGKGNLEAYCSCSHGAGRRMSRAGARKAFTNADLVAQTDGVECRKDDAIIDEIPGAYKDIDVVMENQRDLVEIVHTLKAVLCVKGA